MPEACYVILNTITVWEESISIREIPMRRLEDELVIPNATDNWWNPNSKFIVKNGFILFCFSILDEVDILEPFLDEGWADIAQLAKWYLEAYYMPGINTLGMVKLNGVGTITQKLGDVLLREHPVGPPTYLFSFLKLAGLSNKITYYHHTGDIISSSKFKNIFSVHRKMECCVWIYNVLPSSCFEHFLPQLVHLIWETVGF